MSIPTDEPTTEPVAAALHELRGVHAPVHDELEVDGLEVLTGAIPPRLEGSFLRNGPNPRFPPAGAYHLFDGDGMLHAVDLCGGTARYRNRWIRSRGLEAEIAAGRALYGGMANASFPGPDLVGDAGPMKNVANTNVVRHGGRLLCLWEAGPPTEVERNLSTIGTHDFGGRLRGPLTAHPKIDPETGTMYAFGYSAVPPYLRYHVVGADGTLGRTVEIDLPAPVMMHDFAVTASRAVFLDAPALFDLAGFADGGPMLRWAPELGTRIGVMDRDGDGSDLEWFPTDDCYAFHFLNAYDDHGRVVLDACQLPHVELGLSGGEPSPPAHLTRIEVDTGSGSVGAQRIATWPGDFPRIDDRRTGRRHRVGYVASITGGDPGRPGGHFDSVVAHDLELGTEDVHRFGDDEVCGEPVFAPDPDSSGERDGWVLVHVGHRSGSHSDVVVLDATDVGGPEVARIRMPRRVPFGFHGNWLVDDQVVV